MGERQGVVERLAGPAGGGFVGVLGGPACLPARLHRLRVVDGDLSHKCMKLNRLAPAGNPAYLSAPTRAMTSRTQQLRQSFLLTGAAVALVLVITFAALSGNSAQRTVEQQAKDLGQDVATRVATLVNQYLRERRHEAEALASSPAVVRAALDGAQQAVKQKLPQLDTPTHQRMFNQRRALGGDADLDTYLDGNAQRPDHAERLSTDSHRHTKPSSRRPPE